MAEKVIRVNDVVDCDFNVSLVGAEATPNGGHRMDNNQWRLAIQAGILRELRKLNKTLSCPRFLSIPSRLEAIDVNTKPGRFKCCGGAKNDRHRLGCRHRK